MTKQDKNYLDNLYNCLDFVNVNIRDCETSLVYFVEQIDLLKDRIKLEKKNRQSLIKERERMKKQIQKMES